MATLAKSPRRTVDTEAKSRTVLLRAAEKLFAANGFAATSIRDIAGEAGLNLSLISYYFGSKEQLFAALMEERTQMLEHQRREQLAATDDPWKRLRIVVENIVARLFGNRDMHRVITHEMMLPGRSGQCVALRDKLIKHQREFAAMLQDGIDRKVFRKVDTALVAMTTYGIVSKYIQFREHIAIIREEKGAARDRFGDADRKELERYIMDLLQGLLDPGTKGKKRQ